MTPEEAVALGMDPAQWLPTTPGLAPTQEQDGPDLPHESAARGHIFMAERFAGERSEELRYVHGLGWHRWDGARWRQEDARGEISLAVETVKLAAHDAIELGKLGDQLGKDARKCESAAGLKGMLEIASALEPISTSHKMLDADPYLFNTAAGTLDLRGGELRPHSREDLITKMAGGSNREEPAGWTEFLAQVLPDQDVRAFVQRVVGSAMLGQVRDQFMAIFTGTGANGKGTFRDAVRAAFGDYAHEAGPELLMQSKHERHGTFKMQLLGKRIVFSSETESNHRFAEATMKRLTGGDPIEANLMYRDPITFDPSHTLIMLTNHLPVISGDDPAIWRRIHVVPFDVVIPESQRDPELPSRLKLASSEIVSWAFQGWLQYEKVGLNPPAAVKARTERYQSGSDVVGRFLEARTVKTTGPPANAREVYEAWRQWCASVGETAMDERAFSTAMEGRGFEKKKRKQGFVYVGLMVYADRDEPDEVQEAAW